MNPIISFLQSVMGNLELFLANHPTVKSAWRAAVIVTLTAAAEHYGILGVLQDIFATTGT